MQLDQSTMWQAIEKRLASTTNARHRAMLEVVIEHARAEADRSVERLMATLVDDPQYHFWVGGRDVGPKGRTAVVAYYEQFVGSGGAVFESPKDRVVVDDHNVVSEAEVRNVVPGSVAKRRGYRVPDESGHYVVWFRNVVFFEFGDDPTQALGEDSYTTFDPDRFQRVDDADLPAAYRTYLAEFDGRGVVSEQSERNKTLVLEYMAAFRTFDPDVYFPYLAEEPLYMAGMNIRRGRDAFKANTEAGRILYPEPESATNEHLAVLAEGDWVAVLLERRARTNKVENYENLYGMFYEVVDGRIQTQVELMDFRVAQEQFDLSALKPPS